MVLVGDTLRITTRVQNVLLEFCLSTCQIRIMSRLSNRFKIEPEVVESTRHGLLSGAHFGLTGPMLTVT